MASVTNRLVRLGFPLLLALSLAGCGGSAQSRMSHYEKAFNTAPPEVKAQWDTALNALKSKDYAAALGTLNQIAAITNLAPEQAVAVREVSTAASDEMYDAANKGDAKAKQAIEDLRKSRR